MFRTSRKARFFPQGVRAFLKYRWYEVMGLLLMGAAGLTLLSLITYDPADPSWNTAIKGPIHNLGGAYGAIFADLMIQSFSGASYVFPFVIALWGLFSFYHRPVERLWLRILLMPFLLVFLSLSARCVSKKLGGAIGKIGVSKLMVLIPLERGLAHLVLGGTAFLIACSLGAYIAALRREDYILLGRFLGRSLGFLSRKTPPLFSGLSEKFKRDEPLAFFRKEPVLKSQTPVLSDISFAEDETPSLTSFSSPKDSKTSEKPVLKIERPLQQDHFSVDASAPAFDLSKEGIFQLPPLTLLAEDDEPVPTEEVSSERLQEKAQELMRILNDFGVKGEIVKVRPGPVVTLYELLPAPGIKASRIIGLADDIARSMSALSTRISMIPGHNAIGIELPNKHRQKVLLREMLSHSSYEKTGAALGLALGKDIGGSPVIADLARMPHLLIAGTTGSGKSVAVNTMILSLIYRLSPDLCRFIMIDPKMLELSVYDGIPHLLTPVVTDPKKAIFALKWTIREMEDRYRAMSRLGVRNIEGYNARLIDNQRKGEQLTRQVQVGFDEQGSPIYETQPLDMTPLPYIVVVVDEMADLMMVAGKEIEAAVQRLAQMARAAGIHLIMATQRPSVDVITGTIKANFPTRVSFQVTSRFDSRTILGEQGAEQLLGRGDMLFMAPGGKIQRVHGPFVSDEEVIQVAQFLKSQGTPQYIESVTDESNDLSVLGFSKEGQGSGGDQLYQQALALVRRENKASTSFIQRHLQIGYNRAARIMEQMEAEGIVGAANHVGKREVLAS